MHFPSPEATISVAIPHGTDYIHTRQQDVDDQTKDADMAKTVKRPEGSSKMADETLTYTPENGSKAYSIALADVHANFVFESVLRKMKHAMSNEALASVKEGKDGKTREELIDEWRERYIEDKMYKGNVGSTAERAPRKDPFETECWAEAEARVINLFRNMKTKLPPKTNKEKTVTIKQGTFNYQGMVQYVLDNARASIEAKVREDRAKRDAEMGTGSEGEMPDLDTAA